MAEHWTEFFTLTEPKERERGGITLASTTDSQSALDRAASRERHEALTEPTTTYVEIERSIENPDGSIEHSLPRVKSNIRQRDEAEPSSLEKMTLDERMRSIRSYGAQADAAKVHYGDEWAAVLDTDTPVPEIAISAITELGLPNAPEVAHFIGTHRQIADELTQMRIQPRRVVRRVQEISHHLAMDQLELDQAPYRQFQARRERDIRGRR